MESSKKINVFITGGTGFLGRYILEHLLDNPAYHLIVGKRAESNLEPLAEFSSHLEFVDIDIRDLHPLEEVIDRCDMIIHAAGEIGATGESFDSFIENNVLGTRNLIDLSLNSNIERFIYISSASVFGKTEVKVIDETYQEIPDKNGSHYAYSKYLAEVEVWRGHMEGLNTCILNPTQILGAGDWTKGSPKMIQTVYNGLTYFPTGSNGFVYAKDVAKMIGQLLASGKNGSQYICSGYNKSYKTIIDTLCEKLSVKKPQKALTDSHILWKERLEKIKALIGLKNKQFSAENLKKSLKLVTYSNEKSIIDLNFQYTSFDEMLDNLTEAYLNSKKEA